MTFVRWHPAEVSASSSRFKRRVSQEGEAGLSSLGPGEDTTRPTYSDPRVPAPLGTALSTPLGATVDLPCLLMLGMEAPRDSRTAELPQPECTL